MSTLAVENELDNVGLPPSAGEADEKTENFMLVESSFSATVNAPIEKVDIPSWCFRLPESEYQSCLPAHFSAGATTAPDGRRMSINVEVIGKPDGAALRRGDWPARSPETRFYVRKATDEVCELTRFVVDLLHAQIPDHTYFRATCWGQIDRNSCSRTQKNILRRSAGALAISRMANLEVKP